MKLRKSIIKSEPHQEKNFELKNPKTISIGNITEKSFHKVHTEKTKTQTKVLKHLEGGWPEQVKDPSEPREVNNLKRTTEKKKEDFFPKVKGLISSTTEILKKNLRMDIYEDYFDNANNIIKEDQFSAKIKSVYKDTFLSKKGNSLIVGDEDGKISSLKLSKSFYEVGEQDNKDFKEFVSAMFDRELQREKNIETMYKQKRQNPPKDETVKLAKNEQAVREKIRKIEDKYIPFVSEHFNKKLDFSE